MSDDVAGAGAGPPHCVIPGVPESDAIALIRQRLPTRDIRPDLVPGDDVSLPFADHNAVRAVTADDVASIRDAQATGGIDPDPGGRGALEHDAPSVPQGRTTSRH